jgi:DNA sulfur modification protein DndC
MPEVIERTQPSVFEELGFSPTIEAAKEEVRELYLADEIPWVIGYSGGKDSTAILQLIWLAISELDSEKRSKPIHVISTDTLVENPIVASWVNRSLDVMKRSADEADLPIVPHRLTPEVKNSFWVNLIGKGYPAPRPKFRWCTERLKIMPSNAFIRRVVRENGEAILVLGTRKLESTRRSHSMSVHERHAVRDRLTANASLPNSLVYTPIESWSNDDVWLFLLNVKNAWGYNNKDLLSMYSGASEDGECPVVVDTSTPSCGNSRFGCWVCTLVDKDKSMGAMIKNDTEKEWMLPLLELRNEMDFRDEEPRRRDRQRRDFRRITGRLTYYKDRDDQLQLVPGPYTQESRAYWLKRVLEAQRWVRQNGPEEVSGIELISAKELHEIRRIWVVDKHEIEDLLPSIYDDAIGEAYSWPAIDDHAVYDRDVLKVLRESCGDDRMRYELTRNLLDIERRYRTMASRRGLFKAIEDEIRRFYYEDEKDALEWAKTKYEANESQFIAEDGSEVFRDGFIDGEENEGDSKDVPPDTADSSSLFSIQVLQNQHTTQGEVALHDS